MISNDYTPKQQITLIYVHTYSLNKWNVVLDINII